VSVVSPSGVSYEPNPSVRSYRVLIAFGKTYFVAAAEHKLSQLHGALITDQHGNEVSVAVQFSGLDVYIESNIDLARHELTLF